MTEEELRPFIGKRVSFVLIEDADEFSADSAEGVGTLQAIVDDEAIWGESLGMRWIPLEFILGVEIKD